MFKKIGVIFVFLLIVFHEDAVAANGSITVSPYTGSYTTGQTFTVSVSINSDTSFNAAKATLLIPSILTIEDVTLGDCNFALVKTPTTANPSFVGVILGGSVNACTVYTMKVRANNPGTASINLFDTDVVAYKGSEQIPTTVQHGQYNILGDFSSNPTPTSVQPPKTDASGNKLYIVNYTVPIPKDSQASSLTVVLQTPGFEDKVGQPAITQKDPSLAFVEFRNVPEGVHTITTKSGDKSIAKQIINVAGKSEIIAFGTGEQKPSYLIWYTIIAGFVISLSLVGIAIYFKTRPTPQL